MRTSFGRTLLLALVGAACAVALVGGCSNEHEDGFGRVDNDPVVSGVDPPRASGLRALVGSRSVSLFWDDLAQVARYRVLRRTGQEVEIEIEEGVADTTYTDGGLTNGLVYRYRVAAILGNGLEGAPSDPVFVVPSVYGVLIADGGMFANDLTLDLTLNAPAGTASMRFGTTPDLGGVPWRAFTGFATFTLPPGEGLRTVYAQFLDDAGNESRVVSDDVVVDTRAEIFSVTHDATGGPVAPGATVRFTIATAEVDGEAFIDIEGGPTDIELFDDGAHGDGGADDGTYAVDWMVPTGAEAEDAVVFGSFQDAAGNLAEGTAVARITINEPPTAVVLNPAANVEATSVDLSWSQNQNADFAAYRLLRALTMDVLSDPERVTATVITDRSTTTYTDDAVEENAQVYYVVVCVDAFGATTPSNTISVTTPNAAPEAVVLTSEGSTPVSVSMSWSRSPARDFALYRVLRAVESSPGSFSEVAQFDLQDRTAYTDFFGASNDTTYYFYMVRVEDLSGEFAESNVISVAVAP